MGGATSRGASGNVPIWDNMPVTVDATGEQRYDIPYKLSRGFTRETAQAIRTALRKMSEDICIDFFEDDSSMYDDMISFIPGQGCYSWVGRTGGVQELSIGQGCDSTGTIQHEMVHALGFHHEMVRPDRDQFVKVHFEEIKQGKGRLKKTI